VSSTTTRSSSWNTRSPYDLRGTQSRPVPRGRTWHPVPDRKLDVTSLVDKISKTMVIAATDSLGFHAPMIPRARAPSWVSRSARYRSSVETISEVALLR
jgi:hypothetical protein